VRDKIRIMHVTHGLGVGGIEETLLITAKYNLNHKYELAFVSCNKADGQTARQIRELGCPVFGLDISARVYDLRLIPRLMRLCESYKPEIVHLYGKPTLLGRIAARMAKVPVVVSGEMDIWGDFKLGIKVAAVVKRRLDFLVDKIVPCSEAVRRYWDKKGSDKYLVIYLPFNPTKLPNLNPVSTNKTNANGHHPVIGVVSRLVPNKGHEYLIRAMPIILKSFPSTRLKIVGTGPHMREMKALATSLGLAESIEFTGFVDDLSQVLSTMDVFVLPSLTEGFPLCALEAMAAGLPLAATAVGGIPELIQHRETGLLFPPGNYKLLAQAVVSILSNENSAKKMANRGQQTVLDNFSPQNYIQRLSCLYEQLLQQYDSRRSLTNVPS